MNNKWKRLSFLLIVIVSLAVLTSWATGQAWYSGYIKDHQSNTFILSKETSKKLSYNKLISPYNQIRQVSLKSVKEIDRYMTYEEIIKELGATKDIGSGLYLACYHVDKKGSLIISFNKLSDKCSLDGEELLKKGADYH